MKRTQHLHTFAEYSNLSISRVIASLVKSRAKQSSFKFFSGLPRPPLRRARNDASVTSKIFSITNG